MTTYIGKYVSFKATVSFCGINCPKNNTHNFITKLHVGFSVPIRWLSIQLLACDAWVDVFFHNMEVYISLSACDCLICCFSHRTSQYPANLCIFSTINGHFHSISNGHKFTSLFMKGGVLVIPVPLPIHPCKDLPIVD